MSRPKRIFPNRVFLTLASVATGVSGIFSIYIVDGYSVSSAFSLAWPLGAVFSGAIAAPVIVGPLLTLWSFREVCILDTPHDGNLTVLAIGLPMPASWSSPDGCRHEEISGRVRQSPYRSRGTLASCLGGPGPRGLPVRFLLTPEQASDKTTASATGATLAAR